MNDPEKSNRKLGDQVREHLESIGLETPMTDLVRRPDSEKLRLIEKNVEDMLITLGLDLTDDSLLETPKRVAKMYVKEIFSGLNYANFPKCTTVENKMSKDEEFVCEKGITLYSDCEHHLRPIIGKVHIAYIPKDKVLGLSKMPRIANFFARRPQIQERLTSQICEAVSFITKSPDVIVLVDARHTCVSQRGVQDTTSSTGTLSSRGVFAEHASQLRREFLSYVETK